MQAPWHNPLARNQSKAIQTFDGKKLELIKRHESCIYDGVLCTENLAQDEISNRSPMSSKRVFASFLNSGLFLVAHPAMGYI
jgi:hypothetical protein